MSGSNRRNRTKCLRCSKAFTYEPILVWEKEYFARQYCDDCIVVKEREEATEKASQRIQTLEQRWKRLCPPLYRATDPSHSSINQKILRGLLAWSPNGDGRGIGIYGETGRCKTRMMFLLLKKLLFDGHRSQAISTAKFAIYCGQLFNDNGDIKQQARRRLDGLQKCEILFLDDLGKGPLTPRVEAEFFDLIETRTANMLPTLWTANATSENLARIMSKDRGGPIIRRLKERSQLIAV